jgi:hypothetical protein
MRKNFYRPEHVFPSPSSSSTLTPLFDMTLSLEISHLDPKLFSVVDLLAVPSLRHALLVVARNALCPEVIHFLVEVIAYRAVGRRSHAVSNSSNNSPLEDLPDFGDDFSPATHISSIRGTVDNSFLRPSFHPSASPVVSGGSSFAGKAGGVSRPSNLEMSVNKPHSNSVIELFLKLSTAQSSPSVNFANKSDQELYELYANIVNTFVEEGSEQEVNLSSNARVQCSRLLTRDAFLAAGLEERRDIFEDAFFEVQHIVQTNLLFDLKEYLLHQRRNLESMSSVEKD